MFIRQTQPFLERFCKRNIFECFRENRREKVTSTKSWGQKGGKCNNDANETPRLSISAGRDDRWVLEITSKFMLHTLESPSRSVLSYFSKRPGWLKYVRVLMKYNNFGRLKQFFNIKNYSAHLVWFFVWSIVWSVPFCRWSLGSKSFVLMHLVNWLEFFKPNVLVDGHLARYHLAESHYIERPRQISSKLLL